jgi:hypothetical protein
MKDFPLSGVNVRRINIHLSNKIFCSASDFWLSTLIAGAGGAVRNNRRVTVKPIRLNEEGGCFEWRRSVKFPMYAGA